MSDMETIKSALTPVVCSAVEQGVKQEELLEMVRSVYEAATVKSSHSLTLETLRKGSFVDYWDPKKGRFLAHVLAVQDGNRLELRVHTGSNTENFDVDNVPYSPTPMKEHWSFR